MMMFGRRRSHAVMRMAQMDSGELKTAFKVATAGFIAYQAVKFMMREIME